MPIKWKTSSRFKPAVVLSKIDVARTVNPDGGASFSAFDWEGCIPALHSMLQLPAATSEIDASSLVWRALTAVRGPLTPSAFLQTANAELNELLATTEEQYHLLTTISVRKADIPATVSCLGAKIRFLTGAFPVKYGKRDELIRAHFTNVPDAPNAYTRTVISVKAKSHDAAFAKAMRALDLQRALWCLLGNPRMQITFGTAAQKPINVVRLGGHHTLHRTTGAPARDGIWYEPNYMEASLFEFDEASIAQKNWRWALQRLRQGPYVDRLTSSLIRYVRALDEPDANTAFLRLWTAIEFLTTPEVADYDKLVRRCAFLFRDSDFHRQILEHLREYRNDSVHSGDHSDHARTHCFQLQFYFRALLWFHVRNSSFFGSLEEANQFLDMPPNRAAIRRRVDLARKALSFLR